MFCSDLCTGVIFLQIEQGQIVERDDLIGIALDQRLVQSYGWLAVAASGVGACQIDTRIDITGMNRYPSLNKRVGVLYVSGLAQCLMALDCESSALAQAPGTLVGIGCHGVLFLGHIDVTFQNRTQGGTDILRLDLLGDA